MVDHVIKLPVLMTRPWTRAQIDDELGDTETPDWLDAETLCDVHRVHRVNTPGVSPGDRSECNATAHIRTGSLIGCPDSGESDDATDIDKGSLTGCPNNKHETLVTGSLKGCPVTDNKLPEPGSLKGCPSSNAVEQVPDKLLDLFERSRRNLTPEQTTILAQVLSEFQDVFASHDLDLGCFTEVKHSINTRDAAPFKQKIRRTPIGYEGKEEKHLEKTLEFVQMTLESFLGFANYHREHMRGYRGMAAPLYELSGPSVLFEWTGKHQEAFEAIKKALTEAPCLSYPQPEGTFILDTDASDVAIGAELSQLQDGKERVVAYASIGLAKPQRRYCTTRKELLAVVMFTRHFPT